MIPKLAQIVVHTDVSLSLHSWYIHYTLFCKCHAVHYLESD